MLYRKFCCCAIILIGISAKSQVYIPAYAAVADQCAEANILSNLTDFQNFGIKYRGTAAQANALAWLESKYAAFGYTASQIQEDSYTYSGSTCKNLVITKTGTLYPNIFVIVDAHYDTLNGPGTNDNGSGTAILLEMARLMVNVPTDYSIRFIHFSGEEDGLKGSGHYVNSIVNATNPKMNIRLVFNIDQVGGVAGMVNNTITCERDLSTPTSNNAASNTMTNELITCVGLYSSLNTNLSNAYSSDYVPFENNGEVITGFYETNESTHPHSSSDTLENMDPVYVYNVAKAAIGAVLHFAVASESVILDVTQSEAKDYEVKCYPNPAKNLLNISRGDLTEDYTFKLADSNGKMVITQKITNPKPVETIRFDSIATGVYSAIIETETKRIVKKIQIQ
ncbi:MAG TPA: M28 family peptidase [Flavobacterium sp.]|nr:M28 family peptidase [Flavobacterium sp.]